MDRTEKTERKQKEEKEKKKKKKTQQKSKSKDVAKKKKHNQAGPLQVKENTNKIITTCEGQNDHNKINVAKANITRIT